MISSLMLFDFLLSDPHLALLSFLLYLLLPALLNEMMVHFQQLSLLNTQLRPRLLHLNYQLPLLAYKLCHRDRLELYLFL